MTHSPTTSAAAGSTGPTAPARIDDTFGDLERARALRKMRQLATALLVLAACIFVLTHVFTDLTGVWGSSLAAPRRR